MEDKILTRFSTHLGLVVPSFSSPSHSLVPPSDRGLPQRQQTLKVVSSLSCAKEPCSTFLSSNAQSGGAHCVQRQQRRGWNGGDDYRKHESMQSGEKHSETARRNTKAGKTTTHRHLNSSHLWKQLLRSNC